LALTVTRFIVESGHLHELHVTSTARFYTRSASEFDPVVVRSVFYRRSDFVFTMRNYKGRFPKMVEMFLGET
jgi:hypothetical protein